MFRYEPPRSNNELADIVGNRRHYLGIERFDDHVVAALRATDRGLFAPEGTQRIYEDEPFAIGENQTCSQPSMVAAMAMFIEPAPGMRVLEVGTGCGYSAAVTARLLGPEGMLDTIEFLEPLSLRAQQILTTHFPDLRVRFHIGDGSVGLPGHAPFDRIYLTAGAGKHFDEQILLDQLNPGGILLYPEAFGSMFLVRKTVGKPQRREMNGVGFVMLRGKNSGYD